MTPYIRVLPDAQGKPSQIVRIHFFHRMADDAPITTAGLKVPTRAGPVPIPLGMARGRISCTPTLNSLTPVPGPFGQVPVIHTDHAPAVTCPECKQTEDWKAAMKAQEELEAAAQAV